MYVRRRCRWRSDRHRPGFLVSAMLIRIVRQLFRRPSDYSALEPIQPRVMPDPEAVEALERQRAALAYRPEHGFLLDQIQTRSA